MRPLALLCLFALSALTAAEDKVVIWKLDDVRAGEKKRLAPGFKRVAEWAKVSYAKFARDYAAKNPTTMILVQGHCGMWDDDSFYDFVKIATLLKQDGWTTLTTAQYSSK